ncbi:transferrin receptor protein 2 isoform X2 [Bombina bombina]|nr:transferrin receptor protein 2 isoform X2 [Bombina bombina]
MFSKYLKDGEKIDATIRTVSRKSHPAGSDENQELAQQILEDFKTYNLDHTWRDSHFVDLPYSDINQPNFLQFIDSTNRTVKTIEIDDPELYCPYSANGNVTAGMVYANYGRKEDFKHLDNVLADPRGHIVLVRAGSISFAEKVSNAEQAGAVGVLIFPDISENTAVFGHVHLGGGDPNTPGFPSFNHTQFPPFKSSGLPSIIAQSISTETARKLLRLLKGDPAPPSWKGDSFPLPGLGPELKEPVEKLRMGVQNIRRSIELFNVFGSLTGRVEPEHYIVVGAQRDSWGPGAAKSGVGTAILLELARAIAMMVSNGFQPRRSILFVSWDAGDFGNIGATEWLEGYLSMLHLKAAAYVSLDKAVLGDDDFVTKSSPLLKELIEQVIKQVDNPRKSMQSIYQSVAKQESNSFKPLSLDSGAYAFTAFGGVPALELSFEETTTKYQYLNTKKDTYQALNELVGNRLSSVALSAAEVAGLIVIKLSHDYILPLDISAYNDVLLKYLMDLSRQQDVFRTQGLTLQWLSSARGDYVRATQSLKKAIAQSDLHNQKVLQAFNVRIMRMEYYFLSEYVSVIDFPYRHIIIGQGEHTLSALIENLKILKEKPNDIKNDLIRKQLALITWTLKGAANAISGEVWDIQEKF